MRIVKSRKCAECGHWKIFVHCSAVMLNGCDNYYCIGCWPAHDHMHDTEWSQMSDDQKAAYYQNA